MRRNLELENWLIETTGQEMMANHLGPNWNRFNDEVGFYPNITMTVADQVWQHQQSKVDELQAKLEQAYEDIETFATAHQRECEFKAQFAKEKNELQKRVDNLTQVMEELLEEMKYPTATFEEVICSGVRELEQALKGEQYEEHRKKAEATISNGASLTSHRIEL